MAREEILEKLQKELEKEIKEESQVVYILSRIRKLLELNNQKSEFKYLNFYCNWALHARIDRTESVAEILRGISMQTAEGFNFLTFNHLKIELKKFFVKYSLPENILDSQWINFANFLVEVYSDTPLTFYPEDRKVLTISKPEKPIEKSDFAVAFKITD